MGDTIYALLPAADTLLRWKSDLTEQKVISIPQATTSEDMVDLITTTDGRVLLARPNPGGDRGLVQLGADTRSWTPAAGLEAFPPYHQYVAMDGSDFVFWDMAERRLVWLALRPH